MKASLFLSCLVNGVVIKATDARIVIAQKLFNGSMYVLYNCTELIPFANTVKYKMCLMHETLLQCM